MEKIKGIVKVRKLLNLKEKPNWLDMVDIPILVFWTFLRF